MPLVAWSTVSQPIFDGSLGILSFRNHARLLKLRCAMQLIKGHPTAWVKMVEDLIRSNLSCSPFKRERRHWSPSEALLFNVKIHTGSRIVNNIIHSWEGVVDNLHFDAHLDKLLARLSIHRLLSLLGRKMDLLDQQ